MDIVCHAGPGGNPVSALTFKLHFHLSVFRKRGFCPFFPQGLTIVSRVATRVRQRPFLDLIYSGNIQSQAGLTFCCT